MAVQFILGASGTGKTTYIYRKMIEESRNKVLFILPEQSNMAAEQDMVRLHPAGGTMDISILSFTRLAFKIFDEGNIHTREILDDYGKSMLIMKVLRGIKDQLSYYGNIVDKQGFIDEVKSMLSELYQYQITGKVLEELVAQLSPDKSLYYKLSDLLLIQQAFEEAMADSYMVTEQILSMLAEYVEQSKLLSGAEVYFDGFTGFTPVQMDVIEKMMKVCNNLYFSFTMDESLFGRNDYSEQGVFALSHQTVTALCNLAQKQQIPIMPHVGLKEHYRLAEKKRLYYMERNLFRFPMQQADKLPQENSLECFVANDSREEIFTIAKLIKHYVMEGPWCYSDFAVITGDLQNQAPLWKKTFEQLSIPYFLDYSEVLSHNPVVEVTGLILDLFETDFSYDSVFSFLKCEFPGGNTERNGFLDMNMEAIYDLENYARKYGVRGYAWWNRPFRGGVKGLYDINQSRAEFMEQVKMLVPAFSKKSAPAKEYMKALYSFLAEHNMAEKLMEECVRLECSGRLREAKAYEQVYDKFISVLDKTMDILGEESIRRSDFRDIILTGFADMKLGIIPTTLDQVIIGDMERTRLHHVRCLFVAGTNEGILPAGTSGKGILVDKDRKQLKEMQVTLAPDSRDELLMQQFYFYLQITKASEKVVLSYRRQDEKGGELHVSYFLKRILQMFPDMTVKRAQERICHLLPSTKEEVLKVFASELSHEQLEDASCYRILEQTDREVLSQMEKGYLYDNRAGALDRAIAAKLYGEHMSVSRLETYSGCAYQFFLQYGLHIAKREEYRVESNQIGTILHTVMDRFFRAVQEGTINPVSCSKEELDRVVVDITIQAAKEQNETIFESSFRNRHQLAVLIRIAKRSVENLYRHLEQGSMTPAFFEKRFSEKDRLSYIHMELSESVLMELSGIVDRVDLKITDDTVYVKVIDYKSGAKDIDYVKMYEGRQLQLTVYMSVMLELLQRTYPDKNIIPTGMYYYHIHDPIVEAVTDEEAEQKRVEAARLTGLVNEDEECRTYMDNMTGTVTPVRYTKNGGLDSRNKALVSTEELHQISRFVREKMMEIGQDMIQGKIEMNPEKGEIQSPCNFCDYKSVCRFEAGLGGNAYATGSNLDKEEAKQKILSYRTEQREGNDELDVRSEKNN